VNKCPFPGYAVPVSAPGKPVGMPDSGTFRLEPGASFTLSWARPAGEGTQIAWSGNLALCRDGVNCVGDAAACAAGKCAFAGAPSTLTEITMQTNAPTYYDVSLINGIGVPTSFGPASPASGAPPFFKSSLPPGEFFCGTPGSRASGATWVMEPPSSAYLAVVLPPGREAPVTCTVAADCGSADLLCGTAYNPAALPGAQFVQGVCGMPQGHWTPVGVCGADQSAGAPFHCSTPASNGPTPTSTRWTYFGCTEGISSCFTPGAPSTCCGCTTWPDVIGIPPHGKEDACKAVNPEWLSMALPALVWMKNACPSCYTYPYDDVSSTFLCDAADYEVVFCA